LLARLALESPNAVALAPHLDGRFQPFFARYAASLTEARILEESQQAGGLQQVLAGLKAHILRLSQAEALELRDWDTPEDVKQG